MSGNSRKYLYFTGRLFEKEALDFQDRTLMRLPDGDRPFGHHAPDDDPSVRVTGRKLGVLTEETKSVDRSPMAAEDIDGSSWGQLGLLLRCGPLQLFF